MTARGAGNHGLGTGAGIARAYVVEFTLAYCANRYFVYSYIRFCVLTCRAVLFTCNGLFECDYTRAGGPTVACGLLGAIRHLHSAYRMLLLYYKGMVRRREPANPASRLRSAPL